MASGDTKTNQYLDIAANGNRADLPTDTCCETRTQTLIRGVAERIIDVEEEVEEIKNNPDVVDIVNTYADLQNYPTSGLTNKDIIRVITDETQGGASSYYRWNSPNPGWNLVGVVPGGDGVRVLTTADYNYPVEDPQYFNMSDATESIFVIGEEMNVGWTNFGSSRRYSTGEVIINGGYPDNFLNIGAYGLDWGQPGIRQAILTTQDIRNELTSTSTSSALSANQGRVLKNLIDSIAIRGAGAPTTSTVGEVGQLYEDGTNGALYQLKSIDITVTPNTYNWEEVGGSSINVVQTTGTSTTDVMSQKAVTDAIAAIPTGGVTELTTADYNYPTNNPATVGAWKLEPGVYHAARGVNVNVTSSELYYDGILFIVGGKDSLSSNVIILSLPDSSSFIKSLLVKISDGSNISGGKVLSIADVAQSTGTSTSKVMSQNAVTDAIAAIPTGGVTELTTADYNWNSSTQSVTEPYNCVALWLLDSGIYSNPNGVDVISSTSGSVGTENHIWIINSESQSRTNIFDLTRGGYSPLIMGVLKSNGAAETTVLLEPPVQSTGTSTTSVMSQNAVTSMVYKNPSTKYSVALGANAGVLQDSHYGIAIGEDAHANAPGSIAIGRRAIANTQGVFSIGESGGTMGYNNSAYRLLTGLYDPQSAHDAATKGYCDTVAAPAFTNAEFNSIFNTNLTEGA